MRILLTTDTIGGVWTFSSELTEQLLVRGHAIALVSFGRAPSAEQRSWLETTGATYGDGFRFVACEVPLEWMQDNQRAFEGGSDLLLQVAADFGADLLHSNQFCWGALPGELPRLITAHSDVLSWATACQPEVLDGSDWLSRYVDLVQSGLNGADVVVAPTAWMRDALQDVFEVTPGVEVVHNGRSISSNRETGTRAMQAVSVGRLWDKAKGLSTLLEITSPVPICLAGEQHFETASLTSGATAPRLLGFMHEAALLDLFRRSAIYIASSVYEPFGLAPLEAALCGCAIVARDIPSFREVWGDSAVYFRSGNELEQALCWLARDPEQLGATQLACGARGARFTGERMALGYLRRYEQMMDAARSFMHSDVEEQATHAA